MMQGLITFLLGSHPEAVLLRREVTWVIMPMLNPDGVFLGNYRSGTPWQALGAYANCRAGQESVSVPPASTVLLLCLCLTLSRSSVGLAGLSEPERGLPLSVLFACISSDAGFCQGQHPVLKPDGICLGSCDSDRACRSLLLRADVCSRSDGGLCLSIWVALCQEPERACTRLTRTAVAAGRTQAAWT